MESTLKVDQTFIDDPLRILRGIRIAAKYEFTISSKTYNAMVRNVDRLSIISKERIAAEFDKMLTCDNVEYALRTIWNIGAMKYIIPELSNIIEKSREMICRRLVYAHHYDYITKMAVLLYNTSNPEKALRELKYSNDIINEVLFTIYAGDIILNSPCNINNYFEKIRELQYKSKTLERFVRVSHAMNAYYWSTTTHIKYGSVETGLIQDCNDLIKKGTHMFGYKLPVNGNDVMEHLGIGPGKRVKEVLDKLIKAAYKNPLITREECFSLM